MKITLRHVVPKEGVRPCTAIENVAALGEHPNGWMMPREAEVCRQFRGTEEEAIAILEYLEHECTCRHGEWENYQ